MKSEIEIQGGRLKWLPTAETKNWVWTRDRYANNAWEAFGDIDKIALSISADSTSDGLLRVTVGIMKDGGPIFNPLHLNSYVVTNTSNLPDSIYDGMEFRIRNLADSLDMNYAWSKFVSYITGLESRGDKVVS